MMHGTEDIIDVDRISVGSGFRVVRRWREEREEKEVFAAVLWIHLCHHKMKIKSEEFLC